ncbi:WD40 repeat-like protein [Lichtheimia hyalospora FSU 10163]|nr:WD40 repeat-like protein [Lichtheimia hyalospora FSU 10163]
MSFYIHNQHSMSNQMPIAKPHFCNDIVMEEAFPVATPTRQPAAPDPIYNLDTLSMQLTVARPKNPFETAGNKVDFLAQLPYELGCRILSLLDLDSLMAVSRVSRHWRTIYHDNELWRARMAEQQWIVRSDENTDERRMDWHYLYKQKHQLIHRWQTGRVTTHTLMAHQSGVYCMQFDNHKMITGSRDRTIKFWDMATYQCIGSLKGHTGSVLCLKYDDQVLISGSSDATVIVWDIQQCQPLRQLQGHTSGVFDICYNNQYIVSASKDTTIRIWDFNTGALVRVIQGHSGPVNSIQLYGDYLVSGSGDGTIMMWDITTGACIRQYLGHEHGVTCIRFDGKRIVSGSNDQTVRVWDAETGVCTMVLCGHTGLVRALQFDDEKIVSSGYDQTVRVWSIRTGECLLSFESAAQASWIFDVKFDKSKIIAARQDNTVMVMDFGHGLDTRLLA